MHPPPTHPSKLPSAEPLLGALRLRAALFETGDSGAIEATAEIVEAPTDLTLDELLSGFDAVTSEDVMRVATDLFRDGAAVATIVGPEPDAALSPARLKV